jgi:hypothetical protein
MSQRKRANGFALVDAAFPADRKFLRLHRLCANAVDYAACVGVFFLILADARRERSAEIDFDEYSEYASQVALLQEVRLLREDGFDPETFAAWAPAYRSPWDQKYVRSGTERVRSTTDTSTHINSTQDVGGGLGEGNFMRSPQGHMGQHQNCLVCAAMPSRRSA